MEEEHLLHSLITTGSYARLGRLDNSLEQAHMLAPENHHSQPVLFQAANLSHTREEQSARLEHIFRNTALYRLPRLAHVLLLSSIHMQDIISPDDPNFKQSLATMHVSPQRAFYGISLVQSFLWLKGN